MAYNPILTPDGSYITDVLPSGTYLGMSVAVTLHSGTVMSIITGSYHSAEVGYLGSVADVMAVEGEWKIVRENTNNIMVLDVAGFPLARNSQYCGSQDNSRINCYEFPHHHMTPQNFSGTTVILDDSADNPLGIVSYGEYIFYATDIGIRRCHIPTGEIVTSPLLFPSLSPLYRLIGQSFAVIDQDTIMIMLDTITGDMGYFWGIYSYAGGGFHTVAWPRPYGTPYIWHWAVIGNYLCISSAEYKGLNHAPYTSYYSLVNYIYDYVTKTLIYKSALPAIKNFGNLQYPVCNNLIIGKKYFAVTYFGYADPPIGYDNDARAIIFDVEKGEGPENKMSITEILLKYYPAIEGGGLGCCTVYHMCFNPFDNMIYFIAYHAYKYDGVHFRHCYAVMLMSPDNYSHVSVYEYYYDAGGIVDTAKIPAMLIPGMWEVYCVMNSGNVYNVRDFYTQICVLPSDIWEIHPSDWSQNLDMPQNDKCASCLDRWDRLWYIDGIQLVAVNFKTGEEECRIDAGINPVWYKEYCYPMYNDSFQHVYYVRDGIVVLCNAKGTCLPHPSTTDFIYHIG